MKKIGIIGAGKLGLTLAKLAIRAGYQVDISGSSSPNAIKLKTNILAKGALPVWIDKLLLNNDIIILAIPLGQFERLDKNLFRKNQVIIDAMNYWWEVDGLYPEAVNPFINSTESIVEQSLPDSNVAKAFNHVGYHDLMEYSRQGTTKKILGMVVIAETKETLEIVSQIVYDFGFSPVKLLGIKNGIVLEPGSKLFGINNTPEELLNNLKKELLDNKLM